jgi:phenylacetic acid degradation operon negative regulatory protein
MASAPPRRRPTLDARSTPSERRSGVSDLIATIRPLTARSVLASVLLGAPEPRFPVADLVVAASLFGIRPGAARTCLWRMVANGELTTDNATYALAGHLLERRHRVDDVSRPEHVPPREWDGTWELAVVSLERRPASERLELRKAAIALHLAELREGVWTRPDNLDPARLPTPRAVLAQQCVVFRGAAADISVDGARSLFVLDAWARDARRFIAAMTDDVEGEPDDAADAADEAGQDDEDDEDDEHDELGAGSPEHAETDAVLSDLFTLSIAVVRHLQLDPLLPAALLPVDWPGPDLRDTYRRFERAFKRRLDDAVRGKRAVGQESRVALP